MKVTYNLVCNFLCCLRSHLTSFLRAGHLPLHVSSDEKWRINDGVSALGLDCFLQLFLFLLLRQLVFKIFITPMRQHVNGNVLFLNGLCLFSNIL